MNFLAPIFLLGLAVAAVPIILHLMHRQMPRAVVFPSIRFILKGQDPQQGRRGLRDVLTLLARLALLALVILLFAQPYVKRSNTSVGGAGAAEVLVFVDRSASMLRVPYSEYLTAAFEQLQANHPAARFALIDSAAGPETVLPLGTAKEQIRQRLAVFEPQTAAGDHQPAIDQAAGLFSDLPDIPRFVYVLSDLQAADWARVNLTPLTVKAEVKVLPPDLETPANAAVMDVRQERFRLKDAVRLQVTARIKNFSLTAVNATVTLKAGERVVEKTVKLRSGTTETVVLYMDSPPSQKAVLSVSSPADPFALDDEYHFWIGPRPPVQVGVVVGPEDAKRLEAFFLLKALNTHQPGFTPYAVSVLTPDFILTGSARPYQCLFFLDSLGDYTEVEMAQLQKWVSAGGCLIYFAGRQSAAAVNNLRQAGFTESRFLGYAGDTDQLRAFTIGSVAEANPVTAPFLNEPGDLMVLPIYRYCRIQPNEQQQVLLRITNDDPFLIEERLGRGRAYLCAVNVNPRWSDLPTAVAFVPLLRQMVDQTLAAGNNGAIAATIGEDIAARLTDRGLQTNRVLPTTPAVTQVNGVPVEINYTRAESDPQRAAAVELLARTGTTAIASMPGTAADTQIDRLDQPLAWLLLLFLFAELLLANFGLGTQRSKSPAKSRESA